MRLGGGEQILVHGHFHGPNRTDRDTETTASTFVRAENHRHIRTMDTEGIGGANTCTGTALNAEGVITANNGRDGFYLDAILLEKLEGVFDVFLVAGKLKDHQAVIARQDGGLEDVEVNLVLLHQLINDRFITCLLGKVQDVNLGVHNI